MPNIPDIKPDFDIDREKTIDLLLAAIAMEELGLAHIINSEAEKLQFCLGTLEGSHPKDDVMMEDLLEINKSVERMLRKVIIKEILLGFKLEDVLELANMKEDNDKEKEDDI